MAANYKLLFNEGANELVRRLFSREVSGDELAAACGALSNSEVEFSISKYGLMVDIRHAYVDIQKRSFRQDADKSVFIFNHEFTKKPDAPKGIGREMIRTQIQAAAMLGIRRIELYAAGDANSWRKGYYAWAVRGFDAPLTRQEQARLPESLKGVKTLNELMLIGGDQWWRKFGMERKMTFDLSRDSLSWQVFFHYLRRRGLLKEGEYDFDR